METLFVLFSVFAASLWVTRLILKEFNYFLAGKIAISAMFMFTGISHFIFTKGMAMMLPGFVPNKTEIIYLTGILEIMLSLGFLFPATQKISGYVTIVFLLMVLPSNVYASIHHINMAEADFTGKGVEYLWFRIPLQFFFIGWIYWFVVKHSSGTKEPIMKYFETA